MSGRTASTSPMGSAWGSDHLVPLTPGHGPQPNGLDLTFPSDLKESAGEQVALEPCPRTVLEARLLAILVSEGFDRTQIRPLDRKITRKGSTYAVGGLGVFGERNLRVDETRESGIRKRMVLLGVSGILLFAVGVVVPSLLSIPRVLDIVVILAAAGCIASVLISLGSDAFRSDLLMVYCAPIGAAAGPSLTPPSGWQVEIRAAVVRSENWASKTGSGRSVKESHRDPSLSREVPAVVGALRGETALPSSA